MIYNYLNLSLRMIPTQFLNFDDFEPCDSYKKDSYPEKTE